jgi:hypothetical protein
MLKLERGKGFESISRDSLQDRRLSFKARGIMAYLKSMPDDWETNAEEIAGASDKDGYEAVNNGIKELEAVGLFARLKRQGDGGRWEWLWIHSDDPEVIARTKEQWVRKYGPESRRGGNRQAKGRPDQQQLEIEDADEDVIDDSEPPTVSGFSGHGKPVSGSPVHGLPPNKEIYSQIEEPPQPPRPAGGLADPLDLSGEAPALPAVAGRCPCGKRVCRMCGFNTTRISQAEREADEHARAEHEERGKWCAMCRPDGRDRNGLTFWARVIPGTPEPFSPTTKCDHETPHHIIVKLTDETEEARERKAAQEVAARQRELAERRVRAERRKSGGAA